MIANYPTRRWIKIENPKPELTPQKIYDERYPVKDFSKTTYSFVAEELRKLQSLDTIAQMGQMAEAMITKYVQTDPARRVGIKNSPDIGILYDVAKGEFIVYVPKIWCSSCQSRRGEQMYKERVLCSECLRLTQTAEQVAEQPKKK